jgi:ABC-type antimicrobial peptide transport system permease subunit
MRALGPVGMGLGLGLVAARLGSEVLEGVLYGVDASDPLTFASVGLLLGAVGILAAVVPAWRAADVDPVRVLGSE